MSSNRLADYLTHMQEAAFLACSYVEGLDRATFISDKRTQQAVILNVINLGEAATRLLQEHAQPHCARLLRLSSSSCLHLHPRIRRLPKHLRRVHGFHA
ncbi:MAG: DUF86 domain-containing protein [Betaproteobacteria bacterium]|nr:DUF86 domain-containing protein [Betaproteobacteria bacterium]